MEMAVYVVSVSLPTHDDLEPAPYLYRYGRVKDRILLRKLLVSAFTFRPL